MSVSTIFIRIIGYSNYRKILSGIMRLSNGIHKNIIKTSYINDLKEYSVNGKNAFFGYYDLESINQNGDKLLSIVCNEGEPADVGYFDVDGGAFHKIGVTQAWNWQMGARIRWFNNYKNVLFNDFDGEHFISRIIDLNGTEVNRFCFPLFDIDKDNKFGYFTDFTILHHLRPGYGYSNMDITFEKYYQTCQNGIFKADLEKNTYTLLVPMEKIVKIKNKEFNNVYHYINHISTNPYGNFIMFFHLWTKGSGNANNRVIFIDNDGVIINVLDDFDRASHYAWKDRKHIMLTVVVSGNVEYRIYNIETGDYIRVNGIITDGHPSIINDNIFITDTYPDRGGMENIYICDSNKQRYKKIFSIFHNNNKFGEYRCDLHPRVKGNYINFDSHAGKERKQYVLKFSYDDINYDNQRISISCGKERKPRSLYSHMFDEYKYITNRNNANPLKVILNWFYSPTFRANVWVSVMRDSKCGIKKIIIKNKLETKYSMTVDPRAQIGIHFRADHFIGIVIGPGAKIGDYCKFYQQVTIGQKNGMFPIIGNNVTIYPGAKIIGNVYVSDNAVIGANAVVTHDVPYGAIVAGVPGKTIRTRDI